MKFTTSFLLSVLSLPLINACGQPENAPITFEDSNETDAAIINGEVCAESDHPSAMAIMIGTKVNTSLGAVPIKNVTCTGTLIAPDVVISAGHCVDKKVFELSVAAQLQGIEFTVDDLKIYVTNTSDLTAISQAPKPGFQGDLAEYGQLAVKSEMNPNFNIENWTQVNGPAEFDDISLIFLSEPITDIVPAALIQASETDQLVTGADVYIAGWGQQEQSVPGSMPPPEAGTKICVATNIGVMGDTEMEIGGGEETGRKCHGDSGGPTYLTVETDTVNKERVIGITSHAFDETDCARGGVDTRIDAYLTWINDTMIAACLDGTRSWCNEKGILAPDYFIDGLNTPDNNDSDDDSDNNDSDNNDSDNNDSDNNDSDDGSDDDSDAPIQQWDCASTTGKPLSVFALLSVLFFVRRKK